MLILLVDDSPSETHLTRLALLATGFPHHLVAVDDGEKATEYLQSERRLADGTTPNLILLDLNLPGKHGLEVLRELKSDPDMCHIPVIVLSNSTSQKDIDAVYRLNGNSYLSKPMELEEMYELMKNFSTYWMRTARLPAIGLAV
jgi:chemotaxis family two-component system response regulator Rcp1